MSISRFEKPPLPSSARLRLMTNFEIFVNSGIAKKYTQTLNNVSPEDPDPKFVENARNANHDEIRIQADWLAVVGLKQWAARAELPLAVRFFTAFEKALEGNFIELVKYNPLAQTELPGSYVLVGYIGDSEHADEIKPNGLFTHQDLILVNTAGRMQRTDGLDIG